MGGRYIQIFTLIEEQFFLVLTFESGKEFIW